MNEALSKPSVSQLDDLALFLKSYRDRWTDLDVTEATTRHEVVRSFTPADVSDDLNAATMIFDVCRQDIQAGRSGRVRFEVVLTHTGKRVARFAFAIDAGKPEDFSLNDANAATVLIETLRHNRTLMQMAVGHTEEMFRRMGNQLELSQRMTEATEQTRLKQWEVLELLLSNQTERDIRVEQAKSEAKATGKMVDSFTPLIPALLNRLVAGKTGQQALLPESVKKLLGSIREDQIDKITQGLDPAQQAALMEIMIAYQAEENEANKPPALPEIATNGVVTPNSQGGVG
jgi:hypothetical protein